MLKIIFLCIGLIASITACTKPIPAGVYVSTLNPNIQYMYADFKKPINKRFQHMSYDQIYEDQAKRLIAEGYICSQPKGALLCLNSTSDSAQKYLMIRAYETFFIKAYTKDTASIQALSKIIDTAISKPPVNEEGS